MSKSNDPRLLAKRDRMLLPRLLVLALLRHLPGAGYPLSPGYSSTWPCNSRPGPCLTRPNIEVGLGLAECL